MVKELRTPPDERHWNGVLVGFVPYDLRFPTLERVKERMWNPCSTQLINPRVFGVGWTVNVGRLVALVRAKISSDGSDAHQPSSATPASLVCTRNVSDSWK